MPPSGPTISISESACATEKFRQLDGGRLVQHQRRRARVVTHALRQLGRRHHAADRGDVRPPRLAGRRPGHRTPPAQPLVDFRRGRPSAPRTARPARRRRRRRPPRWPTRWPAPSGPTWAAPARRSHVGDGNGTVRRLEHPRRQPALADVFDDTVRHRPVAVAQVEFLTGADAPDVGRVEAFVAVDDRELTDLGQRVDVEQRQGSRTFSGR